MARDLNDVSIHSGNGLVSSGIKLLPESMLTQFHVTTVYPKKYAHGFCFAVLCCGYTLTDYPISIRLTSLALCNDCHSASKATLMNMDKYFMWIHYERLRNHNKAKHNKTMCIFLGIYCIYTTRFPTIIWKTKDSIHFKRICAYQLDQQNCFDFGSRNPIIYFLVAQWWQEIAVNGSFPPLSDMGDNYEKLCEQLLDASLAIFDFWDYLGSFGLPVTNWGYRPLFEYWCSTYIKRCK